MSNAIAHLGAPAAVVAVAALVSTAAVLGARFGAAQECAFTGIRERPAPAPVVVRRSLDAEGNGGAAPADVEQRIALARARLGMTPEQIPRWEALASALRDRAVALSGGAEESPIGIEPAGHNGRQPLAAHVDKAYGWRAASEKQFATAWAAFYDWLTDEQKETAASLLIRHDGRRR